MVVKTKNVRIRGDLRDRLQKLVEKKRTGLGLRKYRSLREAADDAVELFLLIETVQQKKPLEVLAQ